MLEALIFDFDGLILDTETPLYEAWHRLFVDHDVTPIGLEEWSRSLGRADDDPLLLDPFVRLAAHIDRPLDADQVQAIRRRYRDEALAAMPIQPGVTDLLDRADADGLGVAIASSSPAEWVDRHLDERGLSPRFAIRSCAGGGLAGKPNPDVYLDAAARLGVRPAHCLALEDSPHGVAAAKAAGMACIAVPTPVSQSLDFRAADQVVTSLLDLDLTPWR